MYDMATRNARPDHANRLRDARKAKALTQDELAAAVGASARAVQTWEYGTRFPSAKYLRELSRVLGQPIGWFYGENGHANVEPAAIPPQAGDGLVTEGTVHASP